MKTNSTVYGFVVAGLLTSCLSSQASSLNPNDAKQRWLAAEPCSPPCWENIHPGETTRNEMIELLKENPAIDPDSVMTEEHEDDIGLTTWEFVPNSSSWIGGVVFSVENSLVEAIRLATLDLCLGEIISAYGDPDLLNGTLFDATGIVILVWQDQGFVFESKVAKGAEVTAKTCEGTLLLYPLDTPLSRIPGVYLVGVPDTVYVPWEGYGDY